MTLADSLLLGEIYYGPKEGSITLRAWRAAGGEMDSSHNITTRDMEAYWPWLLDSKDDVLGNIELKYMAMKAGDLTLDDIWHYVNAIEPAENESAWRQSVRKSRLP